MNIVWNEVCTGHYLTIALILLHSVESVMKSFLKASKTSFMVNFRHVFLNIGDTTSSWKKLHPSLSSYYSFREKLVRDKGTDRQTDKQTGRQTGKQVDRQRGREADRETKRETGRETYKDSDNKREAERQIGRQTIRQTGGQTDR